MDTYMVSFEGHLTPYFLIGSPNFLRSNFHVDEMLPRFRLLLILELLSLLFRQGYELPNSGACDELLQGGHSKYLAA